jgi:hypothetical protein
MAYSLNVVGMVMGDEYCIDIRQHYPLFLEIVPQTFHPYTGIHEYLCIIRCQIITITATATAQGHEFYHTCIFLTKI